MKVTIENKKGLNKDLKIFIDKKTINAHLEKKYEENPKALLYRLRSVDPEYGKIVHINNKKRLVRALEIYETTGKTPSDHFKLQKSIPGETLRLCTVILMMENLSWIVN